MDSAANTTTTERTDLPAPNEHSTIQSEPAESTASIPTETVPYSNEQSTETFLNPASTSYFSYVNIRGLKTKSNATKVDLVKDLLIEKNQLFFALTETWLREEKDAEIHIDGYKLFRCDRNRAKRKFGRNSGGVAIYVRDDIANSFENILTFSNGVIELLVIYSKIENLVIACIYRQPDDVAGSNRSTSMQLNRALSSFHNLVDTFDPVPNIIMLGDFNLPHIQWPFCTATKGASRDEKQMIETLNDFMDNLFLTQYISESTHKDGNVLDLVLTNNSNIFHDHCITQPLHSTSDHYIIEIVSKLQTSSSPSEAEPKHQPDSLNEYNYHCDKINWDEVKNDLSKIDWQKELRNCEPDSILQIIYQTLLEVSKKHVPIRIKKDNKSPIPKERQNLMRRRSRINKRLVYITSTATKDRLHSELLDIEIKLQKSRKKSKFIQENNAISNIKSNPKYFYSYAKRFSKTYNKIGPLKDNAGNYVYDNVKMANLFADQYKSVFTKSNEKLPCSSELFPDDNSTELNDIPFTEEDMIKAIDELSANSASGPECVAAIMLKNCKDEIAPALYILWRKCFDQGITPQQLKNPNVVPIHKGGSLAVPSNFRPVALTSHVIKIFEKVVKMYMVNFLDRNNLFNDNQHGFRKGRSCLSQLLIHYEEILTALEQDKSVDVIYLDFCKAFDKVDFGVLLRKLKCMGIGGKLGRWIYSFLTERKQVVIVNGFHSRKEDVESGVPQGSVLGPLLFLIHISNIDEDLKHSTLRCFADDSRVTKVIESEIDCQLLQEDLSSVYCWTSRNKMVLNDSKLEALRYANNQTYAYRSPTNTVIKEEESVKDLGIIMSNDATFNTHICTLTMKIRNLASWILRTFQSREKLLLLTMWKTLVLPIHDYCSQLWSPHKVGHIQQLEDIQRSFIRKVKGFENLDYWERLKGLKMLSLQRRRERYQLIYLHKILTLKAPGISSVPANTGFITRSTAKSRNGFRIVLDSNSCRKNVKSSKKDHSFGSHAVKLFNILPKRLRNACLEMSPDEFKSKLDKYLELIPDEPRVNGYTSFCRAPSNSMVDMVTKVRLDQRMLGRNTSQWGGSPTSP